MPMTEQTCVQCGQPLPEAPEAGGVTVEALDLVIHLLQWRGDRQLRQAAATLCAVRPLVVLSQRAGGAGEIEKLVEEAACKRRIVEGGCDWFQVTNGSERPIRYNVWRADDDTRRAYRILLPEAAAWAEAQAAKRERWSKPVCDMTPLQAADALMSLAGEWSGISEGARHELRAWARGAACYDPPTDRVKIQPEEAPTP